MITAQEVPLTIGVSDMKRAKEFYKDGLGWPTKKDYSRFVSFDGDGTSDLGMYQRESLAKDASVPSEGGGFPGFLLSHHADSAEGVTALLERATKAGAQIVKPAPADSNGSRHGYFADRDGFLWKVASRN